MEKAAIIERVREFRDGRRPSTIMRQLANGYTDAQIEAAASYLAQKR
jgi:sulfide dehydrogenase cytochrome subunit